MTAPFDAPQLPAGTGSQPGHHLGISRPTVHVSLPWNAEKNLEIGLKSGAAAVESIAGRGASLIVSHLSPSKFLTASLTVQSDAEVGGALADRDRTICAVELGKGPDRK